MQYYIETNLDKLWEMRPRYQNGKGYPNADIPGASPGGKDMLSYG